VQKVSVIPARRFEQHPWEIEWHWRYVYAFWSAVNGVWSRKVS
jgi:hypothetical protein